MELTILGIVFSRDRAMQLNGTLQSLFLHCKDADEMQLFVIYKTTSRLHAQQYSQLANEYDRVGFIRERDFRQNVLELLVTHASERPSGVCRWSIRLGPMLGRLNKLCFPTDRPSYVLFLVDDNMFVRDFSLREVQAMLEAYPKALGFSLRLGTNTTHCYPVDKPQAVPPVTYLGSGVIMLDWTATGDSGCDFGYPLEVSSSVYRVSELLPFLNRLPFRNPNTLEGQMATSAHKFRSNPHLLCYERSVAFAIPLNRVQTVYDNRAATIPDYSVERLAKMFEDGHRINVKAYCEFVPNACHQEVELLFEKPVAIQ